MKLTDAKKAETRIAELADALNDAIREESAKGLEVKASVFEIHGMEDPQPRPSIIVLCSISPAMLEHSNA